MPRYKYRCKKCSLDFEEVFTYEEFDRGIIVQCPKCLGPRSRRVYDAPTVKWSSFGLGVGHRYRDPRVEQGLRYEEEKYGAPLTDEMARRVLREEELD